MPRAKHNEKAYDNYDRGSRYSAVWNEEIAEFLREAPYCIELSDNPENCVGLERVCFYDPETETVRPVFPGKKAGKTELREFFRKVADGEALIYPAGSTDPVLLTTEVELGSKDVPDMFSAKAHAVSEAIPPKPNFFQRIFSFLNDGWKNKVEAYDRYQSIRRNAAERAADLKVSEMADAAERIREIEKKRVKEKTLQDLKESPKDPYPMEVRVERLLGPKVEPIPGLIASNPENYPARDYEVPDGFTAHDAAVIALAGINNPKLAVSESAKGVSASTVSAFIFENLLTMNDPRPFSGEYLPCMMRSRDAALEAMKAYNTDSPDRMKPLAELFCEAENQLISQMSDGANSFQVIGGYARQLEMLRETQERIPGLLDYRKENNMEAQDLSEAIACGKVMRGLADRQKALNDRMRTWMTEDAEPDFEEKREYIVDKLTLSLISDRLNRGEKGLTPEQEQEIDRIRRYMEYAGTDPEHKEEKLRNIAAQEPDGKANETYMNMSVNELNIALGNVYAMEVHGLSPLRKFFGKQETISEIEDMVSRFPKVNTLARKPLDAVQNSLNSTSKCAAECYHGVTGLSKREAVNRLDAFVQTNAENTYRRMETNISGDLYDKAFIAAEIIVDLAKEEQNKGIPGMYCEICERVAPKEGRALMARQGDLLDFMSSPLYQKTMEVIGRDSKSTFCRKASQTKGQTVIDAYKQAAAELKAQKSIQNEPGAKSV